MNSNGYVLHVEFGVITMQAAAEKIAFYQKSAKVWAARAQQDMLTGKPREAIFAQKMAALNAADARNMLVTFIQIGH